MFVSGVVIYLALVNILTFSLMSYDKKQASKRKRRVSERRLFGWSAAGGALGTLVAMRVRRHKTKHNSFRFGIPALLVLNAICVYGLLFVVQLRYNAT